MNSLSSPFASFKSGIPRDNSTQVLGLELRPASQSFAYDHSRGIVGNVKAISPGGLDTNSLLTRESVTEHRQNFAHTWNASGRVEDLNRSGIFDDMGMRLTRSLPSNQPLGSQSREGTFVPDISGRNTLLQPNPQVDGFLRYGINTSRDEVAPESDLHDPPGTSSFALGPPVSSPTLVSPTDPRLVKGKWGRQLSNAEPISNGLGTSKESEDARWLVDFFARKFSEGSHSTGDVRSTNSNENGLPLNGLVGNNPFPGVNSTAHFDPPVHPIHSNNIVDLPSGASYSRRGRRPSPKWVPNGPVSIQRLFCKMIGTLWAQDFRCQWGSCAFSTSRQSFNDCEAYLKAVYRHLEAHVDESPTFHCRWKGCVRDPLRQVRCRRSVKRNHFHHIASHLAWYYFCAGCGTLHARFDSPKGLLCSRGKCRASDEATRTRIQEASTRFGDFQAVQLAQLWEFITGSPEIKAPT